MEWKLKKRDGGAGPGTDTAAKKKRRNMALHFRRKKPAPGAGGFMSMPSSRGKKAAMKFRKAQGIGAAKPAVTGTISKALPDLGRTDGDGDRTDGGISSQGAEAGIRYAGVGAGGLADVISRKEETARVRAARQRKAETAEKSEAFYRRVKSERPEIAAEKNPVHRAMQKRRIRREYAGAYRAHRARAVSGRAAGTGAAYARRATATRIARRAAEAPRAAAAFVSKHPAAILVTTAIVLILCLAFSAFTSCGGMAGGGAAQIIATSYTSEDADIISADEAYSDREAALGAQIAGIETAYPGYDEYRYDVGEIGHDPFELASYLTAKLQTYTAESAAGEMDALLVRQYTLTLTPVTETRYRTEARTGYYTDGAGTVHSYIYYVQVPYEYKILNVALANVGVAAAMELTAEQREMYDVYMETHGNKPDLFEGNPYVDRGGGAYEDYDVPPEALTDAKFAAMLAEAKKHLGKPYVFGASGPSSFDCSGFVCYVLNHSGWNIGRKTAQGLFDSCKKIKPGDAKPGDLIFFTGTYRSAGHVSHVGIYVGGGRMVHAGNPVSFADITKPYWKSHLYSYGRLP
jgi:hypothetical protein